MWKPRDYDLEWSKKLINSLKKDCGIWMFSATGKMNEPVLGTPSHLINEPISSVLGTPSKPTSTATFTRNGNKMTLTELNIVRLSDSDPMYSRMMMAKTCFEAIGVECEIEGTVEKAYLNLEDESK